MFISLALGKNSYLWGFTTLKNSEWNETGLFPRITMCDFPVNLKKKLLK